MRSVEDLAHHLHHDHEMSKEEALESAKKALGQARRDREKLDKYEAGKNDNPARPSANLSMAAYLGWCPHC